MKAIPKTIWEGAFTIFGVTLRCCVLDDENHTRVINADDLTRLFEVMEAGVDVIPVADHELEKFVRWQKAGIIP